ncbi:hypothetical protein VTK73DRAFT_4022 [Phialemonium thermophilum]|uniref:Uncharacterized protein n=1 Tax=Phialemonium thermophilum TaxID=223376 RepID=A0ABR3VCR8_9PEZI
MGSSETVLFSTRPAERQHQETAPGDGAREDPAARVALQTNRAKPQTAGPSPNSIP